MEKKDFNKIIIAILSVLVVVLVLVVIYLLFIKKPDDTRNINTENNNQTVQETLPEWATYILNQNITSITYEGYGNDTGEEPECIKKDVTKEQLKDILTKMTKGNLKKFDLGGAGGPCNHGIAIKYNNKELYIAEGKWISISGNETDAEVLSLLEKEKYTYEAPTNDNPWMVFEYKWDATYIDNMFK